MAVIFFFAQWLCYQQFIRFLSTLYSLIHSVCLTDRPSVRLSVCLSLSLSLSFSHSLSLSLTISHYLSASL